MHIKHRYTGRKDIKYNDTGNGWSLATASAWKNSVHATIGGAGMLIGAQALKSLNSIEKILPRMMVATYNGNPSTTIISYKSSNNVSEETIFIAFYYEISTLVRSIKKPNVLVIYAQIGKNVNHNFSLHNSSNKTGGSSNRFHARK